MKIMHIFSRLNRGGAELRTLDMIKRLNSKYKFHICVVSGKKGTLDHEFEKYGVKIHYLNLKSFCFPFLFFKLLKKERIKVLHSHILFMSGYLQVIALAANVKGRISHFRTSKDLKEKKFFLRKIRNIFFRILIEIFSTDILYVSKTAKKNLFKIKFAKNKHKVIYNGFEFFDNETKKEHNTFVNTGRFIKSKNQVFLLYVLKNLKDCYGKNVKITFLGNHNTTYGEEFKNIIHKLQLDDNVILKGEVDNPNDYLSKSEYFLFPSLLEGLPGALIEAHLNQCYVISSNIPENQEVNSYFYKSSKSVEMNVEKWAYIINYSLENHSSGCVHYSSDNPFSLRDSLENTSIIYNKYVEN